MTTLTLATFNIWHKLDGAGLGPETFDNLHDLLAVPGLAAAGLQEIVGNIDEADLPAGWDVWQPGRYPDDRAEREARKDPIVHRADLTILERGSRRISDRIENSAGSVAGRHATWIVTPEWALVTCHLNAGLEGPPGHPVQIPRQREHEQGLHTLVDIADDIQAEYDVPVVVVGDFNVDFGADKRVRHPEFPYAIFTAGGFTCCWEDRPEDSTRTAKPNTGRTIDQLWVRGTDTTAARFVGEVRTPDRWAPGDPIESDHLPVIADLELTPRRVDVPREEEPTVSVKISPPSPPVVGGVPANHSGRGNHPVDRVVIHSAVTPCEPGRARQLGAWNRDGTTGGSWHYAIDPDETIQCSWDSFVCWHAPPNPHSLGNEMCENPTWNPARWLGRNHRRTLAATARLTAQQCLAYNIPIRWLAVADLRAGRRGVTSHRNVTKAFGQSTHTDPRAWPRRKFMRMVRDEADRLTAEGDWFDMATKQELQDALRDTPLTITVGGERKEWRLETWAHHQEQELDDITQRVQAVHDAVTALGVGGIDLDALAVKVADELAARLDQ